MLELIQSRCYLFLQGRLPGKEYSIDIVKGPALYPVAETGIREAFLPYSLPEPAVKSFSIDYHTVQIEKGGETASHTG